MNLIFLASVDSTNAYLLEKPEPERVGMVVYAGTQTAGKGMAANTWESQPGKNLTFSMGVDMSFLQAADQFLLSQAVPLGLLDVLDDLVPFKKLVVKWPNDLLYEGRKLCGILINSTVRGTNMGVSVIGVGLNVNQVRFKDWPTHPISLKMILGREISLKPLLEQLVYAVNQRIEMLKTSKGIEKIKGDYLHRLYLYHQWADFKTKEGEVHLYVDGIDAFGRLNTLDEKGNKRVFDLKEIQLLSSFF